MFVNLNERGDGIEVGRIVGEDILEGRDGLIRVIEVCRSEICNTDIDCSLIGDGRCFCELSFEEIAEVFNLGLDEVRAIANGAKG